MIVHVVIANARVHDEMQFRVAVFATNDLAEQFANLLRELLWHADVYARPINNEQ